MKGKLTRILLVIGWVLVLSVPIPASAATGPGFYYPPPSWDETLHCRDASHCPRFIVLTNMNSEAVLDRETGLV